MNRSLIHDNWRTPLGRGIPAADRDQLTSIIVRAYNGDLPENLLAAAIVPQAWQTGYRTGAAAGAAATGRLIHQMADDPRRARSPVAWVLRQNATELEQGVLTRPMREAINAVQPPQALPDQLAWARNGGTPPLAAVVLASQAWNTGNATGIADGAVMAGRQFAPIHPDAVLDGLPVHAWLELAMTPVHERYAAHHGVPSGVQIAGIPARIAMQASPAVAEAIAGEARRVFNADAPRPAAPAAPAQMARAAFVDNPWSASQLVHPGGNSAYSAMKEADAQMKAADTQVGRQRHRS